MAIIVEIKIEDGNVVGKIKQAEAAVESLDKAGKKAAAAGGGISSLTSSLSKLASGYAALMALKKFVNLGIEYETMMLKVKAVSQATEYQFKLLDQTSRRLGTTTIFTAAQVASLEYELAKLGFTAREVNDAASGILLMAQATGTDLAHAAEIAGNTLRSFNLDASQSARVADVMTMAFNLSALDVERFAESMKYVAPVAASLNVSLEETSAMLAILANRGIHGSLAGTALRNMMIQMAGPTSEAAKKMGGLNLATSTFTQILDEFKRRGLGAAEMEEIFGLRSSAAATVLAQVGGKAVEDFTKQLNDAEGAAKKVSDIMVSGWYGSIKRMANAFLNLALSLFSVLKPLQGLIDGFRDLFIDVDKGGKIIGLWVDSVLGGFNAVAANRWDEKMKDRIKNSEAMNKLLVMQKQNVLDLAKALNVDVSKATGPVAVLQAMLVAKAGGSKKAEEILKTYRANLFADKVPFDPDVSKGLGKRLDKALFKSWGGDEEDIDFSNRKKGGFDLSADMTDKIKLTTEELKRYDKVQKYVREHHKELVLSFSQWIEKMELAKDVATMFGQALGAAFVGNFRNVKEGLKQILVLILSFLEKMSLEGMVAAGLQAVWGNWSAMAKYLSVMTTFEAVKGAIMSFRGGGIVSEALNGRIGSNGMVSGPGGNLSDSILARISTGEAIINARAVRNLGADRINYINQTGQVPNFAKGGIPGTRIENYVGDVHYNFSNSSADPFSVFRNHRNFVRSRRGSSSIRTGR